MFDARHTRNVKLLNFVRALVSMATLDICFATRKLLQLENPTFITKCLWATFSIFYYYIIFLTHQLYNKNKLIKKLARCKTRVHISHICKIIAVYGYCLRRRMGRIYLSSEGIAYTCVRSLRNVLGIFNFCSFLKH